jgi:hypothetical protein
MRIRRLLAVVLLLSCLILAFERPCRAWWNGGHHIFTLAAASKLPEDMPAFFRQAGAELAEISGEPDNWKRPIAPHLKVTEQPEHYIDLEYLEGQPIPEHRADLIKYYESKHIEPAKAGFLPYAIQEGYERLKVAFSECRGQPESKAFQHCAIVYAGWVAHYCEDSAMPLHTTKDYDGKPDAAGNMQQKGIHAKIDAYPESQGFTPEMVNQGLKAERAADVWPLITKAIAESNKHVQRCYELDAQDGFDKEPEKAKELMLERGRAAVKLTLDIWYSAWVNSAP